MWRGSALAEATYPHSLRAPLAQTDVLDEAKMGADLQSYGFGYDCERHCGVREPPAAKKGALRSAHSSVVDAPRCSPMSLYLRNVASLSNNPRPLTMTSTYIFCSLAGT